jgi:hypothetical protein
VNPASDGDSPTVVGGRDSELHAAGAGGVRKSQQARPGSAVAGVIEDAGDDAKSVEGSPRTSFATEADSDEAVSISIDGEYENAAAPVFADAVEIEPLAAPPVMSATPGRVSGLGDEVRMWLGGDGTDGGPAAAPGSSVGGRS